MVDPSVWSNYAWSAACLFIVVFSVINVTRVSGWTALSKAYPALTPFHGKLIRADKGFVGSLENNRLILIGQDSQGIYIAQRFPFSLAAHPIFVPWSDVTIKYQQFGKKLLQVLRFQRVPSISISVWRLSEEDIIDKSLTVDRVKSA